MKFKLIKDFILDKKIFTKIFIATLISGVFSHIMGLTNVYSYHDDMFAFFNVGITYPLGRFSLAFLYKIVFLLNDKSIFSLPLVNGVFTILSISFVNYFIIKILDIKNKYLMILISVLMVTSPSVTSLLGYRFTAPYYQFGLLIGILSIYLFIVNDKNDIKVNIISILMMVFAIGVYQAYISFFLSLTVLYVMNKTINKKLDIYKTIKCLVPFIVYYILSIVIYIVVLKGLLFIKGIELTDYKNVSNFGITNISSYFYRLLDSYRYYFDIFKDYNFNIFVLGTRYLYYILLFITIFSIFITKQNIIKTISSGTILLLIVFPICVQFNFIMAGINSTLQNQSMIFELIIIIMFLDKLSILKNIKTFALSLFLLMMISFQFIVYSNMCWTKANFLVSQTISYNTTLITRIKSTDNYKENMKVCYINEYEKNENDLYMHNAFTKVYTDYFEMNHIINNYEWKRFMSFYNGYNPQLVDSNYYKDNIIIKSMPSYPDDGSVKIIDDVVVVKFK